MAKRKSAGKVNKSEAVREAMSAGVEKPQAIQTWIRDNRGVEVSTAFISSIKSAQKSKAGKTAGGGRRGNPGRATPSDSEKQAMIFALRTDGVSRAIEQLQELDENPALKFAVEMGGVESALAAMRSLEQQVGEGAGRRGK